MLRSLERSLKRTNTRIKYYDAIKNKSCHGYWSFGYFEGKRSVLEDMIDAIKEKELVTPESISWAITYTYDEDSDSSVYLFSSYDEAYHAMKENLETEKENSLWNAETFYDDDGTGATLTEKHNDHTWSMYARISRVYL